jgi:Ubiquitin fusion degradation protein UFD1
MMSDGPEQHGRVHPRHSPLSGALLLVVSVMAVTLSSSNVVMASSLVPISMKHGLKKLFAYQLEKLNARWEKATLLAQLEQEVEDYNAQWVASAKDEAESTSRRRLICLPLDDCFDPPMGSFSHEHIQTGDKMCLPRNFLKTIVANRAEVPWLFAVTRAEEGLSRYQDRVDPVPEEFAAEALTEVVGGPLDFRAPDNYVFLPWWMMRSLGLQPRDVVDVKLIQTIPPGSLAKLRPHSSEFAKDIANPQAVLETELRHYSSLTKGATIAFDYNGKRYWFDIVELRSSPRGEKQPIVKAQDCDLATDFLTSKEDLKKKREAKQAKRD